MFFYSTQEVSALLTPEDYQTLQRACKTGQIHILQQYLEHSGYQPNDYLELTLRRGDKVSVTCLGLASQAGSIEAVKKMIEMGCDVNLGIKGRATPLSLASQQGRIGVVQLLLESEHIQVDLCPEGKPTPLGFAISEEYLDIAERLVEKGADLEKPYKKGMSVRNYISEEIERYSKSILLNNYFKKKKLETLLLRESVKTVEYGVKKYFKGYNKGRQKLFNSYQFELNAIAEEVESLSSSFSLDSLDKPCPSPVKPAP
nr:ankyrin repeat domain-containing protein [Sansalvadorimonas sp. 2012CJ34-2]